LPAGDHPCQGRCPLSERADAGASPSLSILVIDENRLRAAVIEDGLRDAGYSRLTILHDVTGIARRIADIAPDVVIIDLETPIATCWKACSSSRAR